MEVQARLSVIGDNTAELESLYAWLIGDRSLAGRVSFARPEASANELGAASEALVIAVGSGGAISVLAGVLKAWVSLPRRTDVRIRIQGPDGRVVEVDVKRVDEKRMDDLLRQVLGFGKADG